MHYGNTQLPSLIPCLHKQPKNHLWAWPDQNFFLFVKLQQVCTAPKSNWLNMNLPKNSTLICLNIACCWCYMLNFVPENKLFFFTCYYECLSLNQGCIDTETGIKRPFDKQAQNKKVYHQQNTSQGSNFYFILFFYEKNQFQILIVVLNECPQQKDSDAIKIKTFLLHYNCT